MIALSQLLYSGARRKYQGDSDDDTFNGKRF